ncbi:hypothetical protein HNP60_000615 [Sphingobium sp. B1D3A]|uniref:Uncharacterized protein n=1 Tax=Sphingobium lignivorans TaxID=2735886 RepID=A0ABR6NBJ0_9SPHN|nr:hypothetical protein [Sphingobium lignivorans]
MPRHAVAGLVLPVRPGGAPYLVIHDVLPDLLRDPASFSFSNRLDPANVKEAGSRIESGTTNEKD